MVHIYSPIRLFILKGSIVLIKQIFKETDFICHIILMENTIFLISTKKRVLLFYISLFDTFNLTFINGNSVRDAVAGVHDDASGPA